MTLHGSPIACRHGLTDYCNLCHEDRMTIPNEVELLRRSLKTYGRHTKSCWKQIRMDGDTQAPDSCSCGFDAALRGEGK